MSGFNIRSDLQPLMTVPPLCRLLKCQSSKMHHPPTLGGSGDLQHTRLHFFAVDCHQL